MEKLQDKTDKKSNTNYITSSLQKICSKISLGSECTPSQLAGDRVYKFYFRVEVKFPVA